MIVVHGIAIDTSGNAFITGSARINYPTTPGAFNTAHNDITTDAFVSKLGDFSISGKTLDYDGNAIPRDCKRVCVNTVLQMGS